MGNSHIFYLLSLNMLTRIPNFGLLIGLLAHKGVAQDATVEGRMPMPGSFSYTQTTTDRYATSVQPSLSFSTPFAPAYTQASTLLPTNVIYTTYSLAPTATNYADGQYGQSAYVAMWAGLNYSYVHSPAFTTTCAPTPVVKSELIYPPPLPVKPVVENCLPLPDNFVWGVTGSAWQIEGALMQEGRGPSVLDYIGAIGSLLIGESPGPQNDSNVANLNYYLYKQDIARLAAIGIPYYHFSIAWTRIVPFGVANSPVNIQGLDHYDDVINTCLEYGITPIVTLMHFDSPISISIDDTGFTTHFLYYSRQVMARYADRVAIWITFNEPNAIVGNVKANFNALTNILEAHSAIYDWYKNDLKGTGKISIKFANNLAMPLNASDPTHVAAAHRSQNFALGIMANPLFLGQQYPADVLDTPNLNLTALTDAQITSFHGRADFYAADAYGATFVSPDTEGMDSCTQNSSNPLWPLCVVTTETQVNGWIMGEASNAYSYIAPQYVREQVGYIWKTFRPAAVMITEFGFPVFQEFAKSFDDQRYDLSRTLYYQNYLNEVLKAIHIDKVNVIGTLAWAYADNNEFGSFAEMYGMQLVNRTSPALTRTYKRSLFDYVDFYHAHIAAS